MRSEFSSDSIEHSDLPLSRERQFDQQQIQWLEDLKNRHAKIVQVVYPRTANNEKELTVVRGEILEVIDLHFVILFVFNMNLIFNTLFYLCFFLTLCVMCQW